MRILAALSGGVDSAVAAARLLAEGAEVIGVHLSTGIEADGETAGGTRSCCGADDARDARLVAARLGVPFYVVDVSESFGGVIDDFIRSYAEGRTPNPCVECNARVKFGRLVEVAHAYGCEAVATGHYARKVAGPAGRWRLLRGADSHKDQTYVLYRLDQAQLAAARFPLGASKKGDVRDEAQALGLSVARKPDSQDLCFAPDGDYRTFLRERAPDAFVPGAFVDANGEEVGRHDGAAGFTVGQRKGLPALGSPRYVEAVDAASGRVRIAPRSDLLRHEVEAARCCWIEREEPAAGWTCDVRVRIRHASEPAPARLEARGGGRVRVAFAEPAFAPTPGQALVAYVGEAVLCGGPIVARSVS